MTAATTVPEPAEDEGGPLAVFQNGGFLRLWLSQAATQIGGNMVLFGLTVIVVNSTNSNTANSILILSFLVPAVLFSAVAGVYVDRVDRRLILIANMDTTSADFLSPDGQFQPGDLEAYARERGIQAARDGREAKR